MTSTNQLAEIKRSPAYAAYQFFWNAMDWLYPPRCAGCGSLGDRWCQKCFEATIKLNHRIVCDNCGRPQISSGICRECSEQRPVYDALRSWGIYKDFLRNAIHQLKYKNDLSLGDTFSKYLIYMYNDLKWSVDIVIPVPLSNKRYNERGYNQAAVLAYPLSLAIRKPYSTKSLIRVRDTRPQIELSAEERYDNVKEAFQGDSGIVNNKKFLLIDDITTTGATLNACARALKQAGANKVYVLTVSIAV